MTNYSKLGLSIAALGPKITLIGALSGFLAGGSFANLPGALAGAVTGAIVGGVIGGVCILIGAGLMIYDCYPKSKKQNALQENENINNPSTKLINDVTYKNRVEVQPEMAHENNNNQPIAQQEKPWYESWYNSAAAMFSFESKPTVMNDTTNNVGLRK